MTRAAAASTAYASHPSQLTMTAKMSPQPQKPQGDPPLNTPTRKAKLSVCEHQTPQPPSDCPVILTQFICGREREKERKVRAS